MNEIDIRDALSFVSPDSHDILKVGIAVKAALGEAGLPIWLQWSGGQQAWNVHVWGSLQDGGKVAISMLLYWADQAQRRKAKKSPTGKAGREYLLTWQGQGNILNRTGRELTLPTSTFNQRTCTRGTSNDT